MAKVIHTTTTTTVPYTYTYTGGPYSWPYKAAAHPYAGTPPILYTTSSTVDTFDIWMIRKGIFTKLVSGYGGKDCGKALSDNLFKIAAHADNETAFLVIGQTKAELFEVDNKTLEVIPTTF